DKAIVLGLGARESFTEGVYRECIHALLKTLEGLCARNAVVELPGRHVGALVAEHAADILLEIAATRPDHDVFTLIERPEDEKRIVTHMIEQRRRVRRFGSEGV